ncbi:uncharacterized protein LOC106717019 [Papilio machaon]|uniref:uncharacterized protein LOC106717019 n=1 Tax=Papilio machaon TaxID=76193 RepID=UPI001E662C55|nr:uncharacterized protein LOC106717019 [Papilio machaon]
MLKICRILLFVLVVFALYRFVYSYEPVQRTIKISDVKDEKERESFEHYLYQGYWKNKQIWAPQWIKTWREGKIHVPTWKRIWALKTIQEWEKELAPPPAWLNNLRGPLAVELPH